MSKLTVKQIQALKYQGKVQKIFDGGGLYVEVLATDIKYRYRYRIAGKRREYTIGSVGDYTLKEARERHQEARRLVQDGIDPIDHRNAARAATRAEAEAGQVEERRVSRTVSVAARAFLDRNESTWSANTYRKETSRLRLVPEWLNATPVSDVGEDEVQAVVDELTRRNKPDAAYRVASLLRRILQDEKLPADFVRRVTMPPRPRTEHHPHTTDKREIGAIIRGSRDYPARIRSVWVALQVLPRSVCRPVELSFLRWRELDEAGEQIVIPAERMKGKRRHIVPLCPVSLRLLLEQRDYVRHGPDDLVLPGARGNQPYSNNTLNAAYHDMGFAVTGHGWRHTFSTLVSDGVIGHYHPEAIELQLAHRIPGVRGEYMHGQRLDERRRMMTEWSEYLDRLAAVDL